MAKDSMFTGALDSAPIKGGNNKATPSCTYDGEAGLQKRKGGRFPEVNRVMGTQGRLEKPTRKG